MPRHASRDGAFSLHYIRLQRRHSVCYTFSIPISHFPIMPDENQTDEKLLANPLSEKSLPAGSGAPENLPTGEPSRFEPHLSPAEFIKATPPHELKKIFGIPPMENLRPVAPTPAAVSRPVSTPPPKPFDPFPPLIPKKEVQKFEMPAAFAPSAKPEKRFWKIVAVISILIIAVFIGLYIWGGILNQQ